MNVNLGSGYGRNFGIAFAAGAMVLCGSLANYLNYNDYPFFRPEIAIVVAGLLCAAMVMALFYTAQRQWGRSFLEGTLALIFVDLNELPLTFGIAVGLAIGFLSFWRRTTLLPVMGVVGTVILITKMLALGGSPGWIKREVNAPSRRPVAAERDKPAILHIILDEHIGVEGLLNEGSEGRRLASDLRSFYIGNGFALYGGAYSEHMRTMNSIPYVLNYGDGLAEEANQRRAVAGPTRYLTSLVDRGYALTIFQSDYADFCSGVSFSTCITYDSSSLRPTLQLPLSMFERAELIAFKFLALSNVLRLSEIPWNGAARAFQWNGRRLKPLSFWNNTISASASAIVSFDNLVEELRSAQPGQAYFAHILLPHYPYIVDEECAYLPWHRWEVRKSSASLSTRRRAYYRQVRCSTRKLGEALDALSLSPAGKGAIVIVHGDHGSRLTRVDPMEPLRGEFSDSDMVATFSTLFAIRAPSIARSYSTARAPIALLLRDLAATDFRSAPAIESPPSPTVYLDNKEWKPVSRAQLPASWTGAVDRPRAGQPEARVSH